MTVYCSKCEKKLGKMKRILPFEDKKGNQFVLCEECYHSLPIKDKKKLNFLDKAKVGPIY
jgi:NAD-dependent SIR2 family protein deacetylase